MLESVTLILKKVIKRKKERAIIRCWLPFIILQPTGDSHSTEMSIPCPTKVTSALSSQLETLGPIPAVPQDSEVWAGRLQGGTRHSHLPAPPGKGRLPSVTFQCHCRISTWLWVMPQPCETSPTQQPQECPPAPQQPAGAWRKVWTQHKVLSIPPEVMAALPAFPPRLFFLLQALISEITCAMLHTALTTCW